MASNELGPARKRVLDFTNVKDRGPFNPKHKPSGDYLGHIAKVEETKSQAGNDQWVFTITLPDDATAAYPYRCLFDEKQLWKIRNLCVASGLTVPKKKVALDPNKLVGKDIGISLEDDEYEGKLKSVIDAVFPASELENSGSSDADVEGDVSDEDLEEIDIDEL